MKRFGGKKKKAAKEKVKFGSRKRFDDAEPFREGEKDYDESPVRTDRLPKKDHGGRFGGRTTEEV